MSARLIVFVALMVAAGIAGWVATDWPGGMMFLWLAAAVPLIERTVGLRALVRYDPWRGRPLRVRIVVYALATGAGLLITAALMAWAFSQSDPFIAFGPLYLFLTAYTVWAVRHVRSRSLTDGGGA